MLQSAIYKNPERVHQSLISGFEKRCLVALAGRMPSWIHSDHLTILGFLGMLFAGLSYWAASRDPYFLIVGIFWLAVNWFGDSLDGTLARVRNKQRPRYGFYVDHIMDAFGTLCLLGGLALSGFMSVWICASLLIAYYLVSIEIALATVSLGKFRLSFGFLGPTELRILLAIGNLVLLFRPVVHLAGHPYRLFDVGGAVSIAGLLFVVIYSAIKNARTLYNEERI
jgi:archaetidylinositol phosphate synthase